MNCNRIYFNQNQIPNIVWKTKHSDRVVELGEVKKWLPKKTKIFPYGSHPSLTSIHLATININRFELQG